VVTDGERVLVIVRSGRMGPDGRPEVRLPKGHVEPGESREEAARREVGEEAGLEQAEIVADLGHQTVEFDWQDRHVVRDESFFLMAPSPGARPGQAEGQFTPAWLTWEEALTQLTFEAEREWVRRAYTTIQGNSRRT
jgi:8-oxo-dGTP pyrophosphatase MutT (NUDIX family)